AFEAGAPLLPRRKLLARLERRLIERTRKLFARGVAQEGGGICDDGTNLGFQACRFTAVADKAHDVFHASLKRRTLRHAETNEVFGVHRENWREGEREFWRNGLF